jgi:hypothetical protein
MATGTTQETPMADPPRARDPGEATDLAADRESPPGVPRWVKVSGIIVAVLVLLLVIVLLISGSEHGPRRHLSGGAGGAAPRSSVTASLTVSGGGPGGLHTVRG